ncbi:hypothetical protein M1N56_06400 [Dehalococcoidia bacterium]|nr:hypothetical protein [Dehalococcoidia bacterium]
MIADRKTAKFISLAEKRTQRIINNLELIGNLSNRRNYSYTEDQYERIFKAVKKALRESEEKFIEANKRKESTQFSLRD